VHLVAREAIRRSEPLDTAQDLGLQPLPVLIIGFLPRIAEEELLNDGANGGILFSRANPGPSIELVGQ
jgi:hypothetical protein